MTVFLRLTDEFYITHLRDWKSSRYVRYALPSRSDSIVNSHFLQSTTQEAASCRRAYRRNAWIALMLSVANDFFQPVVPKIILHFRDPARWILPWKT